MVESPRSSKRRKLSHPTPPPLEGETAPSAQDTLKTVISRRSSKRTHGTIPIQEDCQEVTDILEDAQARSQAKESMRKSKESFAYIPVANGTGTNPSGAEEVATDYVQVDEESEEFVPRSSGRQRKAPRRLSNEMVIAPIRRPSQRASTTRDTSSPGAVSVTSTPKRGRPRKIRSENSKSMQLGELPAAPYRSSPLKPISKPLTTATRKPKQRSPGYGNSFQDHDPAAEELSSKKRDCSGILKTTHVNNIYIDSSISSAKRLLPNGLPNRVVSKTSEKEGARDSSRTHNVKSIVLSKITGRRAIPLVDLDDEYAKVHGLLEQTVAAGEGNSMLLIGARGTGKTALVNAVLLDLAQKHGDDFHIIRLNGFIHTDDKLALREIWRQLGREMELEEEGQVKNYADTLATLLALLSHPSELAGADATATQIAKSVVFIMDEFDLFAAHPRQTLLYNLFDVAQSRKAPIAVLGLTTRIDIAESLEKRVKSRFSHRYVHIGFVKSLPGFIQVCKAALRIQLEELNFDERAQLGTVASLIEGRDTNSGERPTEKSLLDSWNNSIDTLFQSPSTTTHLSHIYHTTKSIPAALNLFLLPISLLTPKTPHLTPASISPHDLLFPPDSRLALLPSLPTLALALLIAAARLDIILDSDTCNFNMAYEEYGNLAAKARISASIAASATGVVGVGGRVAGKDVARGAWERLCELELLVPVAGRGGAGMGMGGGSEMVRCDVKLEEIAGAVPDLERGLEKWCREL